MSKRLIKWDHRLQRQSLFRYGNQNKNLAVARQRKVGKKTQLKSYHYVDFHLKQSIIKQTDSVQLFLTYYFTNDR